MIGYLFQILLENYIRRVNKLDVFEIEEWDGLAKIGKFKVNDKTITTPALFPVVDPKQQTMNIQEMQETFGFDQVITSAYLMSKRIGHRDWDQYPDVVDYLNYNGLIMMDSGAYQVMVYGDIELGIQETLKLQSAVKTDIGVIMDHPIGYDVSYPEAKRRVMETIENIKQSISSLDEDVYWTLPIQGGKHLDLLETYLNEIQTQGLIEHFKFFALGSVVQVMINQDYATLVDMIALARKYLPEDRPLHLFGAGHPAVFALATFLGCDTYDSAAYTLMAKDNRYMTVEGTYQLEDLIDFPCNCKVCMETTPEELLKMNKSNRRDLLSRHNLYVSSGEIKTIRQHIKDGNLWDLVVKRANSVPNLALATRKAIRLVTEGILQPKFESGIPASKSSMQRVTQLIDLKKPLFRRMRKKGFEAILANESKTKICLVFPVYRSIYNRLPDYQVENYDNSKIQPIVLIPPVGLLPLGVSELFPIGQMINEVPVDELPIDHVVEQLKILVEKGTSLKLYYTEDWMASYLAKLHREVPQITYELTSSALTKFNEIAGE